MPSSKSKMAAVSIAVLLFACCAPVANAYVLLDSAWDPGAGTARYLSPGDEPAPGGATWSVMAAGILGSTHDPHSGQVTTTFTDLYDGVDEISTIGIALDTWAAVSGFTNLGMVTDGGGQIGAGGTAGGVGDIRVGAIFIDDPFNVLAHAYQPGTAFNNVYENHGGDVHFDNTETWSDGGTIDFHTVALHELGHALGLGHSENPDSVMYWAYSGVRHELHADDIAGIRAIYGVPEPSTLALFAIATLGLVGYSRRRRKTA